MRSSKNFEEFFTVNELFYDPHNLETREEQAIFPETSPPSDPLSQAAWQKRPSFWRRLTSGYYRVRFMNAP